MEELFVPYTEALALKELGFDGFCFGYFDITKQGGKFYVERLYAEPEWIKLSETATIAPTYPQAFKFFRDKYNLMGVVLPWGEGLFDYKIYSTKEGEHLFCSGEFETFEEAEAHCIQRLTEIVKKNESRK